MYVMWSSPYMANILKSVNEHDQVHADGTFKIVPEKISQLLVISVRFSGCTDTYPVAFIWCQSKAQVEYLRVWRDIVFNVAPNLQKLNKIYISTDFERAHINAVQEALPNAVVVGCHFHLKQAVYRYIDKNIKGFNEFLNLENGKKRDEFNEGLTQIIMGDDASAIDDLINQFLLKWTSSKDEGERLRDYLESTWFGKTIIIENKMQRLVDKCLFPRTMWANCCMGRLDLNMTNNPAEAFNNMANRFLIHYGTNKPSVKEAVELLRQIENHSYETYVAKVAEGSTPVVAKNSNTTRKSTPLAVPSRKQRENANNPNLGPSDERRAEKEKREKERAKELEQLYLYPDAKSSQEEAADDKTCASQQINFEDSFLQALLSSDQSNPSFNDSRSQLSMTVDTTRDETQSATQRRIGPGSRPQHALAALDHQQQMELMTSQFSLNGQVEPERK
ncbi:hypothetical protein AKO1_009727, partial [Acrasis kona]